jgi:hypothetical protein
MFIGEQERGLWCSVANLENGVLNSREVLGLYRKREEARRAHEHGVFARFRYNDLKEAARDCGGRGPLCKLNGGRERRRGGRKLCRGARHPRRCAVKVAVRGMYSAERG